MILRFMSSILLIMGVSTALALSKSGLSTFGLPMSIGYGDSQSAQIDNFVTTLTVKDSVTLSNGEVVALPLIWWKTPYLKLWGLADYEKLAQALKEEGHNLTPLPVAIENVGKKALVFVGAVDFNGSSVKPVRAFTTAAIVLSDNGVPGLFYWNYYSDNPTNNRFKHEVWGIPAKQGVVENYFSPETYASRLKDENGEESRLIWKSFDPARLKAALNSSPVIHPPVDRNLFVTGDTLRRTTFGINGKYIGAGAPFDATGSLNPPSTLFPYDEAKGDQLVLGPRSQMKSQLDQVDFIPSFWELWSNSGGEILIE